MQSLRSLIITTSTNKCGDTGNKTGVWLEDLAAPYFILKDGGEFITIASPAGGQVPLDMNSESDTAVTENTKRFKADPQAMYHFSHSLPLNEVKSENFDLVFLVGGYGAVWDFPDNASLKHIIEAFIQERKPIGMVGHAVAALVSVKKNDGEPFVKDKQITAFSNCEEISIHLNEALPFLLETKLRSLGAIFKKGAEFMSWVEVDENIITGQNPASAVSAAKQTLLLAQTKNEIFDCSGNNSLVLSAG